MNAEYRTKLVPITDEAAIGNVKEIFESTKAQLGFIPNMYRTMGNSPGYLSTYLHGYSVFRESSGFTPQEQELIFLVLSQKNGCDYCIAAHSMLADKVSKLDTVTLKAIRSGETVTDAKLQALAELTSRLFETRGLINNADAQKFLSMGYEEQQILEIILAISVKTLSNYSNHIFHTDIDAAFESYRLQNN